MSTKETRKNIIRAGRKAVDELIKVAEEEIITETGDDDLAADRLKLSLIHISEPTRPY